MLYLPKPNDFGRYYVVDIETNGLQDCNTIHCLVSQNVGAEVITTHVGHDAIKQWYADLPADAIVVGHNFLSFDGPTLARLLDINIGVDRIVDTLVLSYLYNPHLPRPKGMSGKKGPHSLEAWGFRFKFPKGDFNDWLSYSQEMLDYCVQDVKLTRRTFIALVGRLLAQGFSELSCWIEHNIRIVLDEQEHRGFCFDVEGATKLYNELRALENELAGPIKLLFPPELVPMKTYLYKLKQDGTPFEYYNKHLETYDDVRHNLDGTYTVFQLQEFNLGSPPQRAKRLLSLGWKPTNFTPTGQPKVDEDSLVEFAEQSGRPEVQALADWLVANGRANMLRTWLNAVGEDDRMHGKVFTCGAITRRMRHNTPNTANIPGNEARYGHACRSLWTASPGRVLVGYDASAIEMRVFGHYLNNQTAADLYIYGDPHTANAEALTAALNQVFIRKPVKTDFYAFLYGASNKKLGSHYGKPAKFGKKMRETLLENTPGLSELTKKIEKEAQSGWIETIDGGYVRSLSPHAALNSKLQSAGGIAMKVCAILLFKKLKELGIDAWKVGDIHDEAQLDCLPEDADRVGQLAIDCLREAGELLKFRVPLDGEYKIGLTWAETH